MAVPEPEVWFGIPMQNPKKARLVRIVMSLAVIGVILETAQFVIFVTKNDDPNRNVVQASINLVIALSIPYCGYRGAKEDDNSLLCWFCGCNFAEACYTFMIILWVNQHIQYWDSVCYICADKEDFDYDDGSQMNDHGSYRRVADCLFEETSNIHVTPEYCTTENFDKLQKVKSDLEAIEIPLAIMNLVMFFYGNELYRSYEKVQVDIPMRGVGQPEPTVVMEAQASFAQSTATGQGTAQPSHNYMQLGMVGMPLQPMNQQQQQSEGSKSNDPMATFARLPFAGEAMVQGANRNHPITSYTTYATAATLPQMNQKTSSASATGAAAAAPINPNSTSNPHGYVNLSGM